MKSALIKERQAKGLVDQEVAEYRRKHELLHLELDEKVINQLLILSKIVSSRRKQY